MHNFGRLSEVQRTCHEPVGRIGPQQSRFNKFRRHYNEERPHEALGQRPPAELYARSQRVMPDRIEDPWYHAEVERLLANSWVSPNSIVVTMSYAFVSATVRFVPMLVEVALCPGASSWCGEDEKALLFSRHFIEEGTQLLRAPDRYDLASLTLP
jgi:hypothetical protein